MEYERDRINLFNFNDWYHDLEGSREKEWEKKKKRWYIKFYTFIL